MRVLMTGDAVGGVFTYAVELAEGLADHGIETVLAVAGPPPSDDQRRRAAAAACVLEERPYALEWMDDPWDEVACMGEWLLDLVGEHHPDLVHLNGYVHGALPLGPPKIVVGHSCVLSWHEAVRRRPAGREWERYRDAVAAGIAGADGLVAPTHALLEQLQRLYRPRCDCAVITNGIAPNGFIPLGKEPFILGVGRVWDEAKNLAALERVAPRLRAPVVIVGEGSAVGCLEKKRLEALFSRAAVFAEPARYEPFGLAALEAGLSGCALVLGDIPSLREVWGEAAVYVDPFDDELLVAALGRLLADDRERGRLGRAARRRARSYSRKRMASGYLDLYRRVLADPRAEAA